MMGAITLASTTTFGGQQYEISYAHRLVMTRDIRINR